MSPVTIVFQKIWKFIKQNSGYLDNEDFFRQFREADDRDEWLNNHLTILVRAQQESNNRLHKLELNRITKAMKVIAADMAQLEGAWQRAKSIEDEAACIQCERVHKKLKEQSEELKKAKRNCRLQMGLTP